MHYHLDYDGDSQMASSPESSHAGSRTPTTTNPPHPRSSAISPPGSHQAQKMADRSGLENGSVQSGGAGAGGSAMTGQGQQQKQKQKQPGESWMNKRAEDDYQRALEYVVDKDFSLSE